MQGFRGWGVGQNLKIGGPVTWEWCVQGGTRALGLGIKPEDASQDGASETFTDRKEAGLRGHGGGEGPRCSTNKSQGDQGVRVQGGPQWMADSCHDQGSCREKPAASVRDATNTGVSPRHQDSREGPHHTPRREMEGTEGGSGGGPQTGAPGPGGFEIQGEHESQRDEQERGRAAERSREGSEVQGRGAQPEGQAKGGRCSAQRGARAGGSSHLARGAPGHDVRAEGQGEARQAGSGLEAQGEGEARGQGFGAASSEAQGAPPEGVRQDAEGQASGPVAKGWVVAELGGGWWEGCVEQRAAGTAVEAEARERRESKSGEDEVPVGSEAPSGVEANQAVGGGGSREAQDQRGRGAGSVTERPSPAQASLTSRAFTTSL